MIHGSCPVIKITKALLLTHAYSFYFQNEFGLTEEQVGGKTYLQ